MVGKDTITVRSGGGEGVFRAGETFLLDELGDFRMPRTQTDDLPAEAVAALTETEPTLPAGVKSLIAEREAARAEEHWEKADRLRDRVVEMGYEIQDTPNGPRWRPAGSSADWQPVEYDSEEADAV